MPNTAHQLRAARQTSGMSQVELAKASATDQSLISHVESGSRDTRTRTLGRLMSTMGHQMVAIDSVELTALDAAIRMRRSLARQRPNDAGRELHDFSAGLWRADDATAIALTHSRPPTTEHLDWDMAIAGVVFFRLDSTGAPKPSWLNEIGQLEEAEEVDGDALRWFGVATDQSLTSPHDSHAQ